MSDDLCPECEEYSFPGWFEMQTKLAAREKRMREVAEEMRKCDKPGANWRQLRAWRAKLLEGLGAE